MRIVAPHRRTYHYVQHLAGSADEVFVLLCPVRECEWVYGWEPGLVVSTSGVAEAGCAFTTPDGTSSSGARREAVWVITDHAPADHRVAMVKVSPDYLVTRLWITVAADGGARSSAAEVTYEYTALGPDGDAFIDSLTPQYWAEFMQAWERQINAYLAGVN